MSADIPGMWYSAATRCANCTSRGWLTSALSSGWPTSTSWISSSLSALMLENIRSSSRVSRLRFCASSKISMVRRPLAYSSIRKSWNWAKSCT